MAVIIPYYLIDKDIKNECNLRQAWMSADMEDGLPFYHIKSLPYDTAETVLLEGGNFYLSFNFEGDKINISKTITDPSLIFGNVTDFKWYKKFIKEKINKGYIQSKLAENKEVIERTKRYSFTSSSSKEFDLYMGQNFMDNYLRGGYPVRTGSGKHILYVYSRKHGGLEREYNFFQVDSTNYSQRNSNFRDVNQNRSS